MKPLWLPSSMGTLWSGLGFELIMPCWWWRNHCCSLLFFLLMWRFSSYDSLNMTNGNVLFLPLYIKVGVCYLDTLLLTPPSHSIWNMQLGGDAYTLTSVMSPLVLSLPLLYPETLWNLNVLTLNLPLCCHISFLHITCFDIKVIYQRIQTTCSYASCCHHCHYCYYCSVDFVLFHNVTCYMNPLLSRIHVNNIDLINIMCTLVGLDAPQASLGGWLGLATGCGHGMTHAWY